MTDTTLEQALDEWLSGGTEELYGPPENQEQADRLLWALRGVRRRRDDVMGLVKDRLTALTVWRDQQLDQLGAREADLERILEGWSRAQHADTGRQTWKLPAGELKVRALVARAEADARLDPEQAVASVKAFAGPGTPLRQADVIKTVETLLVGPIKKAARPGDLLPDYPDVPDGYEAHEAVVTADYGSGPTDKVVHGVVLLVPVDGPDGQKFSAVTP